MPRSGRSGKRRRPNNLGAVFLDRDGVVNCPPPKRYVTSWEEFQFLPGALAALKRMKEAGLKTFILSNQAGVGRGWMSRSELMRITRNMLSEIQKAGGQIRAVHYCTHAPDRGCACRKPRLGLIRRACRQWRIDPKRSVVVGDHLTDIEMGQAAGSKTILVLTGAASPAMLRQTSLKPDHVAKDLRSAVRWILQQ